jgi:phage shock protein A
MSLIKRLSATLFSRVDQAVSQIENHDAVIDASIRDARRAAAQAKVRLARVRNDGQRLHAKLKALREAQTSWTDRARGCAENDEDTALECLCRRRDCQRQAADLESTLERHGELERRLAIEVQDLESRVSEISQQRNLMRTRQSAAEALRSINAVDSSKSIDIDDTFERWEIQITEAELATGQADPSDTLERQFLKAEDREALRAELRAITCEQEN